MAERDGERREDSAHDAGSRPRSRDPDEPVQSPEHGFWWMVWLVLKTVQARLRFVVILIAIGGLIAYWDTFNAYYEKWTRPAVQAQAASADVEYFCPMHPYIVRDKPGEKCPICHMDLAKRKKGTGEPQALPPGTVSRVQLTPYRVVLAGVQTTEVQYQPLFKEINTYGSVEFDETREAQIAARQKARIEKLYVNFTGQMVEKGEKLADLDIRYTPELTVTLQDLLRARQAGNPEQEQSARRRLRLWDIGEEQINEFFSTGKINTKLTIYSPSHGHVIKKYQREGNFVDEGTPLYDVADLSTVWIEAQVYEADQAFLRLNQLATATTLSLPNQEFGGKVSFIFPHLDENTRTLGVRLETPNADHKLRPGMYASVSIKVLPEQIDLFAKAFAKDDEKQKQLRENRVLAVPDTAVIDTGRIKVVYREASPNTYEGVAVQLGPRMALADSHIALYPVLSGLNPGDRIVTSGSFLIDAETRLNPEAGSIYFGGSGSHTKTSVRPSTPESPDTIDKRAEVALSKLGAQDRRLAEAQRLCPITDNRLDSMGVPVKLTLNGEPIFLCCEGCVDEAKANAVPVLAKVGQLKAKVMKRAGSEKKP
jgi:membrane fusion protein, copper/silver efflux system